MSHDFFKYELKKMIEDRHYNKCKHVIHLKMDDMYLFEINFSSNAICLNGKKLRRQLR